MSRFEQVQVVQLAVLLDALDGVRLSAAERRSVEWLAGWERDLVDHIAAIIRRARETGAGTDHAAVDRDASAGARPWEVQVGDAVRAVFPAEVAQAIVSDEAIGALNYWLHQQCQDTDFSPTQVLRGLSNNDREFCVRAEAPAAFLASRIRDGAP